MLANTRYRQAIATSPASSDNTASALASIIDSGADAPRPAIAVATLPSAM